MKTIFEIRSWKTNEVVGTATIEGNWGEPAFRNHCYQILDFYKTNLTKTDAEIRPLESKVKSDD